MLYTEVARMNRSVGKTKPHYEYYTVAELAGVTSLRGWPNRRVKVIGMFHSAEDDGITHMALHEGGNANDPVNIRVDAACVNVRFGHMVVVYGDLSFLNDKPSVIAMFVKDSDSFDIREYKSSLENYVRTLEKPE
ncbi:hypothetical protein GWK47_051468 [Chionoecetes opilio]|uniref:Uncharacterized protein n=1 Tax=Chionoecetes opilio TaxID=41210 RepID=A0A8J4Y7F1_CHIOP|nr:hypothetical protein GWK47_051468 [Chionoecetes opilio]